MYRRHASHSDPFATMRRMGLAIFADDNAPPADPGDAADAAAASRVAEAFPDDPVGGEGAPASAPAEGAPPDGADLLGDDDPLAGLDTSGMSYRDGQKLAQDIAKTRDRYKPFSDAFGDLDDDQRAAVLDAAPNLGADLATLAGSASQLHPDDRRFFADAMALMATDPDRAAAMLEYGVQQIREALGGGEPAPGASPAPAPDGAPADGDDDRPVTMKELRELENQRQRDAERQELERTMLADARKLGYDPEATEGPAAADSNAYFFFLSRTGDSEKAHQQVEAWKQAQIDAFVAGKSADAGRPAPPADAGGAPAPKGAPMETLDDADAAMRSRLDGVLGPDPRRRGDD